MSLSDETKSLIHLSLIYGVGNRTLRRLLDTFPSAQHALNATSQELARVEGLTPPLQQRLIEGRKQVSVEAELARIDSHECRVITLDHPAYPPLLKEISDPPLILYVKGELPEPDAPLLAIVGARSPTSYGKTISKKLSEQLAQRGFVIVSGFASGIDTCAHRGALDAGGRTIAVMGNGLAVVYPDANLGLADEISESGALISEFPMTMPPKGGNFPRRNRIISGLCLGTLVVEASERSGSLITARCAAEQGREVFAVPGQIFSKMSQGTHALINQGATLVQSIDDLLNALPSVQPAPVQPPPTDHKQTPTVQAKRSTQKPSQPVSAAPNVALTADEQTILAAIGDAVTHIDQIVRTTQLPIAKVSGMLVMLELKGVIKQLPGKQFTQATGEGRM